MPLHHVVCSGSLDTVKALVNAGADLQRRDSAWQATALGWAEHNEETTDPKQRARYAEIASYLRAAVPGK